MENEPVSYEKSSKYLKDKKRKRADDEIEEKKTSREKLEAAILTLTVSFEILEIVEMARRNSDK